MNGWVFNMPQYTGEEGYIEPTKYACCNCGEKMEKGELADHAAKCQKESKRDKSEERVDYSQLKQGVKVKLKSWHQLVKEFGVDYDGDINRSAENMPYFWKEMKPYCGDILTINDIYRENSFDVKDLMSYGFDFAWIESIIQEEQLNSDFQRMPILPGNCEIKYDAYYDQSIGVPWETEEPPCVDDAPLELKTWKSIPVKIPQYTPPKRVKALWLGQTEGEIPAPDLHSLCKENFVGFLCEEFNDRCIIIVNGDMSGYSVYNGATYASYTKQKRINGQYYIFTSAKDLYLWLAEVE